MLFGIIHSSNGLNSLFFSVVITFRLYILNSKKRKRFSLLLWKGDKFNLPNETARFWCFQQFVLRSSDILMLRFIYIDLILILNKWSHPGNQISRLKFTKHLLRIPPLPHETINQNYTIINCVKEKSYFIFVDKIFR